MLALMWRSLLQGRLVLLGCIVVLTGLQVVIVGQASALEENNSFGRMAEFVPGFLQRGLGSQAMLLVSFKGTVALGYFHPVVAALISILAVYFVTEPAYEVESGLVDLTLARSIPRHVIVTRSIVVAASAVAATTMMMATGTAIGLRLFSSSDFDPPSLATRARMLLHLGAVAACFGGFALAVASGARRWSTAFTVGALTVVALYLLDFLAIGWPPLRPIAWISPFHYYPALSILTGDAPVWLNLTILMSAAFLFCLIGYWRFERRDL
jgi:ABC-2 type transport system permease protein